MGSLSTTGHSDTLAAIDAAVKAQTKSFREEAVRNKKELENEIRVANEKAENATRAIAVEKNRRRE